MIINSILHMADLHLGTKNLRLPADKQKILTQENLDALADVFLQPCDIALICGDLFHSSVVSQKIMKNFFKQVERFAKPVLYICGNHDEKTNFSDTPTNFHVLNEQNNVFRTENIDFWCASSDYKNFDENKKNVLLLHGSISNKTDHDYLDLTKILTKKFDYVALGHEHNFWQGQTNSARLVYSGSLFSNGFDECGQKGYVLIDCKDFIPNFHPLKQRLFKILNISVSDISDFYKLKIKFQEQLAYEKQNVVRVVFSGYYQEGQKLNFDMLKSNYDGFYLEIVDKTKMKIDIEKYKNEPLSFKAEFIKLVEEADLSEEDKNKILRVGIEALQGDDLSL